MILSNSEADKDAEAALGDKLDWPSSVLDGPDKLSKVDVWNNAVESSVEEVKLPDTRFPTGGIPLLVTDGSYVGKMELELISKELLGNSCVEEAPKSDEFSREIVADADEISDWIKLLLDS